MRNLVQNTIILLVAVAIAVWAIVPPEKKLRRGKDLAGGASLVYQVYTRPGETGVIGKVIEVIKDRIDPTGVMEISIVAQGPDRIEITMPLPDDSVKKKKAEFEATLAQFAAGSVTAEQFDRLARLPAEQRQAEVTKTFGSDPTKVQAINLAFATYDQREEARAALAAARAEADQVAQQIKNLRDKGEPEDSELLRGLIAAQQAATQRISDAVNSVAEAELAYEPARQSALTAGLTAAEVRRALQLPDQPLRLWDKNNVMHERPSPRARALDEIRAAHPGQVEAINAAIAEWEEYQSERRALDDPADLIRMLKGAGVLNFRIAVEPGRYPQEAQARSQLLAGGPRSVKLSDVRWYKINKLDAWVDTVEALKQYEEIGAASYFANNRNAVVEEYRGEPYMLLYDQRGMRLTEDDGDWSLRSAYQTQDSIGRPAIGFQMDSLGASRLGTLTENNVGKQMAVLLDDEVYTAPRLNSRISDSGIIEGTFSQAEIDYVTRVLSAGSLKAKLSEEPISVNVLGPELGADNLHRGLVSGVYAFILVAGFMLAYYFGSGLIAVIGLIFNGLFLLALMSLNHAAFTLPGIAGVILAFGMAVDANVLIYERLREELQNGNDLRTSVRLAYSRAMAPIVDGNLTHLITCLVLGFFGTQEIKGFAVTMSIGVLTTLFCQLFITRLIYTFLIEKVRIRKLTMLPMAVPGLQRAMTPSIDWLRLTPIFYTVSGLAVVASLVLVLSRGSEMLDTEFLGGTKVTVQFKNDANDQPIKMTRAAVEEEIKKLVPNDPKSPLAPLRNVEVLAVDPDDDNITSSKFTVKSSIQDANTVLGVVSQAFGDKLDQQDAIQFSGNEVRNAGAAPIYAIVTPNIGETIDRPGVAIEAPDFVGGAAILLENLGPGRPTVKAIEDRITFMKNDPQFSDSLSRTHRVMVVKGTERDVESAVVLVHDDAINYLADPVRFNSDLRPQEWSLVVEALSRTSSAASVQSFSASVAADFANKAVVSILLASVLILIYVGVRFNSVRYSAGALIATLHDCVVAVGFIALGEVLYNHAPNIAGPLGILPFKIDLNVIAAVLTILGYSLNDKIVVMDRIRENRGKLPFASKRTINMSINQTISRTIMTGMTTFLASLILYFFGGEAIRAFAYCFIIGVVIGTYSSVAIAAPFVWSRKMDRGEPDASPRMAAAPAELATA